ncbi:MAG: hypothetical protein IKE52_07365 [Mogibacterium sp.]|nr:hypothetical protein [Mogibacterium sp.]
MFFNLINRNRILRRMTLSILALVVAVSLTDGGLFFDTFASESYPDANLKTLISEIARGLDVAPLNANDIDLLEESELDDPLTETTIPRKAIRKMIAFSSCGLTVASLAVVNAAERFFCIFILFLLGALTCVRFIHQQDGSK